MGWFFDCFRVQNEGKGRRSHSFSSSISSRSKVNENLLSKNQIPSAILQKKKEDTTPFEQVTILKSTSNHERNRENKDQNYECRPASKNQLSTVFLREDLEEDAPLEKIEDVKPMERTSTGMPKKEHKHEEKDSSYTKEDTPKSSKSTASSTDSKLTNSFIDKHILEEESPNSIIKTPVPNNEATPDLCNSTDSELAAMSLSQWLKPPKPFDIFSTKSQSGNSTNPDRPIIGSVATHWSEESETVSIPPPKVWDGKGIPNSTNKYKEDQKVSWHATPFEERLEKALSEEKLNSRRICSTGIPLEFTDEGEESDTAAS
ncbi:Protein JASON [Carex littledalei]|uniref:Protein JASON n=1 Tax=Carex littledalei TaxID=544730 RepID=A0A833V2W5_9POAL|nr:Protein JASON [Carex littledalei]